MLIGELATEVGVNPKTIRYYESVGVLPEPARTAGGYRNYTPADIERLAFVRRAQELDLQLDEIREILVLRERGEQPCAYVLGVAEQRLGELDERIAAMRRARTELGALLTRARNAPHEPGRYCDLIDHRHADPPPPHADPR